MSAAAAAEETVHTRLWERSLELERRRAAEECGREETRRVRATEGHVNDRSIYTITQDLDGLALR